MKKLFLLTLLYLLMGISIHAQNAAVSIDKLITSYKENGFFDGSILVADKGNVIFKKGYGKANIEWDIPNTPDVKFRLGSITKQFTSMLIMQLVEKGKVKLDGKVTDYLPYYRKDTGDKITIHMLLTHTSGIPNYTNQPDFFNTTGRMYYAPDDFVKEHCSGDLEFEPGSQISYSNSGYFILGTIIEHVTGMSYADVLKKNILDVLGMKDTGYDLAETIIPKRASGYDRIAGDYKNAPFLDMSLPYAAGSMYSTVEDLFIWDKALQTDKLLPAQLKEKLFRKYMKMGDMYYGYGWMTGKRFDGKDSLDVIVHGGGINGFNTINYLIPAAGQYVIIFSNAGGAPLEKMTDQIINILDGKMDTTVQKSLVQIVWKTLEKEGTENAIRIFRDLKVKKNEYAYSEGEINKLGYNLLSANKVDQAIEIFKLNTEEFPKSSNVYDSYGEALLKKGLKDEAVMNYKKSLELNPGNTNAVEKLKEMGAIAVQTAGIKLNEDELKEYAGKYQLAPQFIITVTTNGTQIFGQATGQPQFEMFALTHDKFFLKVVDAKIGFLRREGKITSLILFQNGREMPGKKIE